MGDLSRNFSKYEFACRCCGAWEVEPELVILCQSIRDGVGVPLEITSGVRCQRHNRIVGGAKNSYHIPRKGKGRAVDITFAQSDRRVRENILRLYVLADRADAGGIGLYPTWIHIDTRKSRSRWIDPRWEWTG